MIRSLFLVLVSSLSYAQSPATVAPSPTVTPSFSPSPSPSASPSASPSPSATPTPTSTPGFREFLRSWLSSLGESADTPPVGLESEPADVPTREDLLSEAELREAQAWQSPNFAGQSGSLGWSEHAFDIPKGFETRVAFWRDIYTKYTTNQGVLHDRDHLGIVYDTVDFSSIMNNPSLSSRQKAKAREKLVDQKRKEITERLRRLDLVKTPDALSPEDLKIWKMFSGLNDPDKFRDAAERGRVRFQLGQRDRFYIGIFHSGRYLREMERIFREERLPVELTRLPFVESSFNIRARSRVGASGIWQFMPRTARPYMSVSREIDERNDPLKATRASARLLKQNYLMLESWPLAVTGYNHGPNGIRRITDKLKTRDLVEIVERYASRSFGFASENFYACFLAALDVERNAKKYFGEPKWGPEATGVEVKTKRPMPYKTLVEFFDGDKERTELLNPHLVSRIRDGRVLIPAKSYIRVPAAKVKVAEDFHAGKFPLAKISQALRESAAVKAPAEQKTSRATPSPVKPSPTPKATPIPVTPTPSPSPSASPTSTPTSSATPDASPAPLPH